MKKTVNANINQTVFIFEEDAYELLNAYLDSINSYFSKHGDMEIVTDIEARIGEKLLEAKKSVIQKQDIEPIITSMGSIQDLSENEEETAKEMVPPIQKKLYRDPDNTVIAGVASGLAHYFGTDPTLIRLLFIISLFFGGTGLIVYLALLIAMPEAKTPTDKMQMYGEPITIKNIKTAVKQNFGDAVGQETTITRIILLPFRAVGILFNCLLRVTPVFIKILLFIIGLGLILGGIGSIAGLGSLAGVMVTRAYEPYIEYPFTAIMQTVNTPLIIGSTLLAISIPIFVVMILGGIAALRRKNPISLYGALALTTLWIASLAILSVATIQISPKLERYIKDTHIVDTSYQRSIPVSSDITALDISGVQTVTLTQSSIPTVVITGKPEIIDMLSIATDSGTLRVRTKSVSNQLCINCSMPKPVNITIALPNPDALTIHNIWDLQVENINVPMMQGSIGSEVKASFTNMLVKELALKLGYRTGVTFSGTGGNATISVGPSARFTADSFSLQSATVNAAEDSLVSLNVAKELSLNKAEDADVTYIGQPLVITNSQAASPSAVTSE